jgi:hypothetical protein
VKNFQPFYTFNSRRVEDLRLGAAILKEFVDLENEKAERAARSKVDQKAVTEAITQQVGVVLSNSVNILLLVFR